MSWAQEEWKSGLPRNALAKITDLEDHVEKLVKERKCQQMQSENTQAALDKSRACEEATKKQKQITEKNLANLGIELEDANNQLEKYLS